VARVYKLDACVSSAASLSTAHIMPENDRLCKTRKTRAAPSRAHPIRHLVNICAAKPPAGKVKGLRGSAR